MRQRNLGWWKEWWKQILAVASVPAALVMIIWWNFPGPNDSFCSCPAEPFAHTEPSPLVGPHRGESHEHMQHFDIQPDYEVEFQRCNDAQGSHRFLLNTATGYARCVTVPRGSSWKPLEFGTPPVTETHIVIEIDAGPGGI